MLKIASNLPALLLTFGLLAMASGCADRGQPLEADDYVTITFTTRSPGGNLRYDPLHVHALWVEDGRGRFIRTLGVWGRRETHNLTEWNAQRGEEVDAITAATAREYGRYSVVWDLRDLRGAKVPDDEYTIRHELTNHNAPRNQYHRTQVIFVKDGAPSVQEVEDRDDALSFMVQYSGR